MQISILKNSEVITENTTYRLDAEFFQNHFLEVVNKVESNKFSYIENITSWVTQGPNPYFSKTGIPCLTGRNINKGEVSYLNSDYVDKTEYQRLSRYQLQKGDTLITLKGKGSIGKIGYVTENKSAIFSRDIGIVRPASVDKGYLNVFLLCKYGKMLIDRGETGGTGQSTLTTSYLKSIPIPRFNIEEKIGQLLCEVEFVKKRSNQIYTQAQALLLSELGLSDWKPKHQLTFIKNYSDTKHARRMDAEYYQPKYEEVVKAIKNYSGGWKKLVNLLGIKDKNFQPQNSFEYNYVELAHIGNNGEITNHMKAEGSELPTRARRKVSAGDVVISSIEGSLTSIALVEEQYDNALCSTGFYVVNSVEINSECLLILLKSIVGQIQLKKGCNGTILTAINKDEFSKIILPILPPEIQTEISQKVTESFALRKQSKHLLESAKRAVEMAIEQDEDKAMRWLEGEVKDQGGSDAE